VQLRRVKEDLGPAGTKEAVLTSGLPLRSAPIHCARLIPSRLFLGGSTCPPCAGVTMKCLKSGEKQTERRSVPGEEVYA
jgi:hypothetical protein